MQSKHSVANVSKSNRSSSGIRWRVGLAKCRAAKVLGDIVSKPGYIFGLTWGSPRQGLISIFTRLCPDSTDGACTRGGHDVTHGKVRSFDPRLCTFKTDTSPVSPLCPGPCLPLLRPLVNKGEANEPSFLSKRKQFCTAVSLYSRSWQDNLRYSWHSKLDSHMRVMLLSLGSSPVRNDSWLMWKLHFDESKKIWRHSRSHRT